MQHIKLNLLEKEDVIKYTLLLQQEGVEICHRVDFYDTVEVRHGDKREEIDVYDGDIAAWCKLSDIKPYKEEEK